MISTDIGIDLGTSNVLIYIKKKGIVLNEPSVIAIEKNTKKVLAVGSKANEIVGRTPGKVITIKPLKDGVITDLDATEIMLNEFIKKIKGKNMFVSPRVLICCPCKINTIEKDALREAVLRTGARKVFIEAEAKMAAIGIGLNTKEAIANMIIDIGGGTTDIAVISLSELVISNSIKLAGNTFNSNIIEYVKEKYKLLIGEQTAENIKITFANVNNPDKNKKTLIKGRDLVTGLPRTVEITQDETKTALEKSIFEIVKATINVLENTPPELSSDIVEKGIVLTGGSSKLTGLLEVLEQNLKVPVFIAESPLTSVAEGAGVFLDELDKITENNNDDQ